MLPLYAELHCRSNFSFLTGASRPEELVARAVQLGYAALAITDECSFAGVVRAHQEAKRCGLALIIGAEIRLSLSPNGPASAQAAAAVVSAAPARRAGAGSGSTGSAPPPRRPGAAPRLARADQAAGDGGSALPPGPVTGEPRKPGKAALGNASRGPRAAGEEVGGGPPRPSHAAAAAARSSSASASATIQPQSPAPASRAGSSPAVGAAGSPAPSASIPRQLASLVAAAEARAPAGADASFDPDATSRAGPRLVLLAQSRRGYGNLSLWITVARRRAEKGGYLSYASDVEGKLPEAPMLTGLPGCLALLVPMPGQSFETVYAHANWLKTWFGDRAAMALELLRRPGEEALVDVVTQVATLTGLPVTAAGDVLMHVRSRKPLQDVLTATRLGRPVAECGAALASNAEQHLRARSRLAQLYRAEWLRNALVLAGRCQFSLDELRYEYPEEIVPPGHTPTSWLRALTEAGVAERFPDGEPPAVRESIEHELALIERLRYEPYFLTVADIVHWAREQGILCQGRGSAANSVVCYCLGVTAVDPAKTVLLFERFISAERNEPPDIDIDFEHQRREEVIQYLYRKYGRHRAALTAVVISYRPRSALRDVGRALGIDLDRIDAVAKSQHWFDGRKIDAERLRENGFDPDAPVSKLWAELTQQLIGFPRHLSQHPGGFVIAREALAQLVPVENAAMDGRSVIQWDKDDLDVLGLLKVDLLALGMLSAIRRALDLVGTHKLGRPLAMHELPHEDPATYEMLCRADSVGVFQVESRAQMSMLPRLAPRCFYDLVVEVAIVRPGPIQGGMVHPYLTNRALPLDQVVYPSEEVKEALARTRGVPIFQEQVMQLAILAADFTPGEADQLRRAMAAWKRRGGLGPFHERLVGRMLEKGCEREYAERIFKQIEGFGEYGFPESHAASFALLVYVSSWLKCHHPDAFLAALLNSQPMGFYAPAQLVRDAREHGVEVRPVDVLASDWDSTLEGDPAPAAPLPPDARTGPGLPLRAVRLGLNRIHGFAEDAARRLVAARAGAPFASVEDLARRAVLDARALELLAQADALAGLLAATAITTVETASAVEVEAAPPAATHRHQALWAVRGLDTRPTAMLRETRVHEDQPALLETPAAAEDTLADYRVLGLTLKQHPLALLREQLSAFRVQPASVLRGYPHGRLARASGLVTHRQRPDTAKGTVFVTLEDETGAVNVIVWPRVVEQQRRPLLAATLLTVYGIWQREGEGERAVMHLVAQTLVDHTPLLGGLTSRSRDFH